MKITKNQLRDWITEALNEVEDEESSAETDKIDSLDLKDRPFDAEDKDDMEEHSVKFTKDEMSKLHKDGKIEKADDDGKMHTYIYSEGGKGSGRPAKPGGAKDTENKMMKAADDANAKMDAAEKAMKAKKKKTKKKNENVAPNHDGKAAPYGSGYKKAEKNKKKKVKENVVKETTKRVYVKEIKQWMKTLEENRYKKIPHADCRRVAWFVNNNMSESYDDMPESMRKKWSKAAYGREKFLAKEFIKSKKNEQKLREAIRNIINTKIRG